MTQWMLEEFSTSSLQKELQRRREAIAAGICDYCKEPINSEPNCRFPARHFNWPTEGTPITEEWLAKLFPRETQVYWPTIWLRGGLNIADGRVWCAGELVCELKSQEQLLALLEGINYKCL